MSKASDYADRVRAASLTKPQEIEAREGITMARVDVSGHLFLGAGTFLAADALRLRDWLTENFGEEPMTHLDHPMLCPRCGVEVKEGALHACATERPPLPPDVIQPGVGERNRSALDVFRRLPRKI